MYFDNWNEALVVSRVRSTIRESLLSLWNVDYKEESLLRIF